MQETPDPLDAAISNFEAELGLRANFFNDLSRDDDWSFIIKLHALLDAVLTRAICASIQKPELETSIGLLDFAREATGKVSFAKALNLVSARQHNFLNIIAIVRNKYAHSVSSVSRPLAEIVGGLSKKEKKKLFLAATPEGNPQHDIEFEMLLEVDPRAIFRLAALGVLCDALLHIESKASIAVLLKEKAELAELIAQNVLASLSRLLKITGRSGSRQSIYC